ncbi:MAG TPA: hypothetical protein VE623_06525 [Acidimicrobiales bacterium]|nr:hypothetical protein [Acidimicrobiales bacterium]
MNVLGHTFVALAVGDDDPAYVLGAVLPDLAPMLNVRIDRSRLDGRVGEGVRCHIEADAVFHGLAEFRSGAAALRRDLAGRGLDRGPVRALGHAGWELLLDGALVGSAAETAYWRALGAGDSVIDAIAEPDRRRWLHFLGYRDRPPPLRYDDPTWVAERMHALLARRPRLGFPRHQLPDVARVLDSHVRHVAAVAPEVLAATAEPLVRARPRPT